MKLSKITVLYKTKKVIRQKKLAVTLHSSRCLMTHYEIAIYDSALTLN